jgi:cytoskeletal protein RodZ
MGLSSIYAIASFLPQIYVINITTGISFSGIFMNLTRFLILFLFNSQDESKEKEFIESLIYYGVSIFVLIICLILTFLVYKNEYFLSKFKEANENTNETPNPNPNTNRNRNTNSNSNANKNKTANANNNTDKNANTDININTNNLKKSLISNKEKSFEIESQVNN